MINHPVTMEDAVPRRYPAEFRRKVPDPDRSRAARCPGRCGSRYQRAGDLYAAEAASDRYQADPGDHQPWPGCAGCRDGGSQSWGPAPE